MQEQIDVIVVGAGFAGLAAAEVLQAAGKRVLILEARAQPGGRARGSWALGPGVDVGASWLHGTNDNLLYDLAVEKGLAVAVTDYDSVSLFREDGRPETHPEAGLVEFENLLEELGDDADRGDTVADRLQSLSGSKLPVALQDFLIANVIEEEYAADITELSAQALEEGRDMRGDDVILKDTYSALVDSLSASLDFRFNTVVTRIQYSQEGVVIQAGAESYSAKQAVVTLPLGVLKQGLVQFQPPLAAGHRQAIDALGVGLLNKVFLRFPTRFWPAETQVFGYQHKQRGRWLSWYDYSEVTGAPILLGFCAATAAQDVELLDDDSTLEDAMRCLRRMFGERCEEPTGHLITRWGQDAFACGAYSFLKVGARPRVRRQLAEPLEGRLYFAGEATDGRYPASTHGAFRSGRRAAKDLLKAQS